MKFEKGETYTNTSKTEVMTVLSKGEKYITFEYKGEKIKRAFTTYSGLEILVLEYKDVIDGKSVCDRIIWDGKKEYK